MKNTIKHFILITAFLISCITVPVHADHTSKYYNSRIEVEYKSDGETVLEINTLYEPDSICSYTRRFFSDGTVEISENGKMISVFKEDPDIFFTYLRKIGSRELYTEFSVESLRLLTSNYGCGHNDKIHQYIGAVTETVYASALADTASVLSFAQYIAQAINSPLSAALYLASNIFDQCASHAPYKTVITRRMYDVLQVGSMNHLFFCYHVYSSFYNGNNVFLGAAETYYQEI